VNTIVAWIIVITAMIAAPLIIRGWWKRKTRW
jgi:hypothetical protein